MFNYWRSLGSGRQYRTTKFYRSTMNEANAEILLSLMSASELHLPSPPETAFQDAGFSIPPEIAFFKILSPAKGLKPLSNFELFRFRKKFAHLSGF